MKLEFLGSGGAGTIPKPLCQCRVCVQAREKGVPYSRTGPSLFIHGPDVLFDTPEEIKHFHEPHAAGLDDGKIVAMIRYHKDYYIKNSFYQMEVEK